MSSLPVTNSHPGMDYLYPETVESRTRILKKFLYRSYSICFGWGSNKSAL